MFCYSLSGYEEKTVLTHEDKFTKKQFEIMCKEAPLFTHGSYMAYDSSKIRKYLKEKYGFKDLEYTAGFFVDEDIE